MPAAFCAIFLRDWTQCIDSFSLLLLRCVWKGVDAKNPAILRSFNLMQCKWSKSKNCDWNLGNTPISREPPITNRISWNLPRKYWNTLGSRILEKKGKWNAEQWHLAITDDSCFYDHPFDLFGRIGFMSKCSSLACKHFEIVSVHFHGRYRTACD